MRLPCDPGILEGGHKHPPLGDATRPLIGTQVFDRLTGHSFFGGIVSILDDPGQPEAGAVVFGAAADRSFPGIVMPGNSYGDVAQWKILIGGSHGCILSID